MSRRILVVDDSEVIRKRLQSMVDDLPRNVVVRMAADVRQALQQVEREVPDLVILDLNMPGGSGLEVLRDIKLHHPQTRVAILTNYAQVPYRKRCAELGADAFLDKSTEFEAIRGLL